MIVGEIHKKIVAQGIPIEGIRQISEEDIQIQFSSSATPEQQQTAQAILTGFPLEFAKETKLKEISTACNVAIVGGFSSSALGNPHSYGSELENQINLIGARASGIEVMYTCADASGDKRQRLHTSAQIEQVFADGMNHKLYQMGKYHQKRALVEAAATIEEVEAIAW